MEHIVLPFGHVDGVVQLPAHRHYLEGWLQDARAAADAGIVSSSVCVQGALAELGLDSRLSTDWLGIADAHLRRRDGAPLAYSAEFAERLHRFNDQAEQVTVHAIHTRWWLAAASAPTAPATPQPLIGLLLGKVRNGWLYDHDVSGTVDRHRMRSEFTQSLAQGLEVLSSSPPANLALQSLAASLASLPQTGYMAAEYFRLRGLERLRLAHLAPADAQIPIARCGVDLQVGYCDFAMESKVDAYMGTKKRTSRDHPIHSPMTACHVAYLCRTVSSDTERGAIQRRLALYVDHLRANPMDIPAFKMRDVDIPFGLDRTPIEILCAAHLIRDGAQ